MTIASRNTATETTDGVAAGRAVASLAGAIGLGAIGLGANGDGSKGTGATGTEANGTGATGIRGNGLGVNAGALRTIAALVLIGVGAAAHAELRPEPLFRVETLPERYPAHWIIVQDASFFHMNDGKFIVLDADSDEKYARYKGMFNGSLIAQFAQAATRPEMYVAQTFYSRGHRGERTDVLTVHDNRTLEPVADIVIPPKRASVLPTPFAVQLVDDEKLALIFNFTPGTSVSVVDVVKREYLAEVPIPGCALIYPTGQRGFSSLCGNGTFYTVALDETGGVASTSRTAQFFNTDVDPLFEKPAMSGRMAWFPTFRGQAVPVDFSGETPEIGEPWAVAEGEPGGWRPGGLTPTGMDAAGRMYLLMHPEGRDDTHKDPGVEVWVFDPREGRRLRRIELETPGLAIELTRDDDPLLVVTTVEMTLDVYDAGAGERLRTIGDFGQETPLLVHGAR